MRFFTAAAAMFLVLLAGAAPEVGAQEPLILINEVLYNPAGQDTAFEWVEIVNRDPGDIYLADWILTDAQGGIACVLPPVTLPPGAYLVVRFQVGSNDFDFTDGEGLYSTGNPGPVFDNDAGAVALYRWGVDPAFLVDFVAWSATGAAPMGLAVSHAFLTGDWPVDSFFDVCLGGGHFVAPWTNGGGETIGRDAYSSDTNTPADWTDHGGAHALADTEGRANAGPYYRAEELILIAQQSINQFLWEFGLNITGASHMTSTSIETESDVQVSAEHSFTVTSRTDGTMGVLSGPVACHWYRVTPEVWRLDMNGSLFSTRGMEHFDFSATETDSGLLVELPGRGARQAGLMYATPLGFPVDMVLDFNFSHDWTDPVTLQVTDTRRLVDGRGIDLVRTTLLTRFFPDDGTEHASLDAMTTFMVPPGAPIENFSMRSTKHHTADGGMTGVLEEMTLIAGGRIGLAAPAPFVWTVAAPDSVEMNMAFLLGAPDLGYFPASLHAAQGLATTPLSELVVRGSVVGATGGLPPLALTFYADGFWKKFCRVLNATGWGVLCAGGAILAAPSGAGSLVAAGGCAAGGVICDDYINETCPDKKAAKLLLDDIPPPLIDFPRLVCSPTGVADLERPAAFALEPSRPNPVLSRATIAYEIPAPGPVRMAVYDPAGRLVRRLFDADREPGRYEAVWDTRDEEGREVAPGVYLARLETGGETRTIKVVVARR